MMFQCQVAIASLRIAPASILLVQGAAEEGFCALCTAGCDADPECSICRFTYEEEQDAEAFFVPLVWSMIVADTALPWRHAAIVLFTPAPASSEGGARTESTSSVFDPQELRSLQSLSMEDGSPGARPAEGAQQAL